MTQLTGFINRSLRRLWDADRPLTAVGLLMLGTLVVTGIGLVVDPRTIGGDPAWLKPAKFAVSTAIYSLTLAWVLTYLPDWPRTRRIVSRVTATVFVLEVVIIAVQAWRGVSSHFNVGTPLDAVLFGIMGAAIGVQTVVSALVAVALFKQPIADRAMGAALRAGMVLTLLGASSAGLMTMPTAQQMETVAVEHRMVRSGAHTVGAPDGGPGLPGTGWSREHGDLRIPHFFGLHALQALPLIALVTRRRRDQQHDADLVRAAAVSYGALFGILVVQALRGESLIGPSAVTLALFGVCAVATLVSVVVIRMRAPRSAALAAETRGTLRVSGSH